MLRSGLLDLRKTLSLYKLFLGALRLFSNPVYGLMMHMDAPIFSLVYFCMSGFDIWRHGPANDCTWFARGVWAGRTDSLKIIP